jgi:hypothetical protein
MQHETFFGKLAVGTDKSIHDHKPNKSNHDYGCNLAMGMKNIQVGSNFHVLCRAESSNLM